MNTLGRAWIRVAPENRDRFDESTTAQLAQCLERVGCAQVRACERSRPDDILGWVFATDALRQVGLLAEALQQDSVWCEALTGAERGFDWDLEPYQTDAILEKTLVAGGTRRQAWLNLDAHDGLPSVLINDIAGDDRLLYLATYEGLFLFDGAWATGVKDPDGLLRWIQKVAVAPDGAVWMCTLQGQVVRYADDRLDWFSPADGLPPGRDKVLSLAGDGRLFVAGDGRLVCHVDRSFRELSGLPADVHISTLKPDRVGVLVGTTAGLFRSVDEQVIAVPGSPDTPAAGTCAADGTVWAVSDGRLQLSQGEAFVPVDGFSGLNLVGVVLCDSRDNVWVATEQDGLAQRLPGGGVTTHSSEDGLSGRQPRALFEDQRGSVWAGAWGGGLSRHDGSWVQTLGAEQGMPRGRVESLCEGADGDLWMATWGNGVLRYDGDQVQPVAELACAGEQIWSSLRDNEGRMWFGSFRHGAVCWDQGQVSSVGVAEGLGEASVWGVHQDRQGRMWFATQGGGLSCLEGGGVTNYTTEDGLPHNDVWAVAGDDDGAIWCCPFDAGLCRFDGKRFERFTTDDGLAHNQVWCILRAADGGMWFGTWGGGVSHFDGTRFTTYSVRDGLANNSVRALCQSSDGHLWFGTFGGGVSRYDGRALQTFSRREGLVHDAVQDVVQLSDGAMWVATEEGVTRYVPPTEPPTIDVEGVIADRRYDASEAVSLSTAQSLVSFEYMGASFSTPLERMVYAWRVGETDDWHTTRNRRAEVRDLPVGRHVFEVCAVDRDLNTSPPARKEIVIEADADRERLHALQVELAAKPGTEQFIGRSRSLIRVLDEIDRVAAAELTVLIQGETGTGKGLAAHAIHSLGTRRDGPFLQLNCGAIPDGLVESELFGHEKGAFTGAVSRRIGRFELADGGTLFLDEIGDLSMDSQRALLQVLQEGVFHRVGGQVELQARARVIAATNRDLLQACQQGTFREDLYYRLAPFVLHMPPLRERQEDVPLLTSHFLERFSRHLNRQPPQLSPQVVTRLAQYTWPGNVRELEHLVQRAVLVCQDDVIRLEDLPFSDSTAGMAGPGAGAVESLDDFDARAVDHERQFLRQALEAANWIIYGERGAARRLGVHPEKLRRRLQRAGLQRPGRTVDADIDE